MDDDYERVKSAITFIAANVSGQPTLDEVASHVGLSPSHFQRLFVRWAGVSPKRLLQHLTAARAKELLRDSKPVLDTAFAVGLSGPGRLHDLMVVTEAVSPGEYAAYGEGVEIRYGVARTPFGRCLAAMTERGVCSLRFVDSEDERLALEALSGEWRNASIVKDEAGVGRVLASIFEPLDPAVPAVPLHLKGTNFQLQVWQALLRIPRGSVVSYGDLAARIGAPTAARAVATAVGANPVAYVIPCHRVLRATGGLGGYRWGADRKLVMLERELCYPSGSARLSPPVSTSVSNISSVRSGSSNSGLCADCSNV
jgi:AraC family transcriptional regulator, regulatory protein of adaptative response / methylated-DNA-[protein]-cysteine methyltransferase